MSQSKRNALILLAVAIIMTLLLAMSLPRLTLLPGTAYAFETFDPPAMEEINIVTEGDTFIWILRGLLAIGIIGLPFYIIYSLLTAEGRKRLVRNVITILLLVLVANYLRDLTQQRSEEQEAVPPAAAVEPDALPPGEPLPVFTPEPPGWLTASVVLVVSFIAAAIIVAIILYVRQQQQPEPTMTRLAEEAETAISEIHAGGDFKSIIVRCYHDMSQVLREERGLSRDRAMTPREFEQQLISKGLPGDAIRTLTRLFESVRYGSLNANTADEQKAIDSLTEIAAACQPGPARHG